jgi:hypothetical protein
MEIIDVISIINVNIENDIRLMYTSIWVALRLPKGKLIHIITVLLESLVRLFQKEIVISIS